MFPITAKPTQSRNYMMDSVESSPVEPLRSAEAPVSSLSQKNEGLASFEAQIATARVLAQLSKVHTVLNVAGMLPVVGEPLDCINGVLYAASGDYANAAFSMAALIPLGGVFASGGKLVKKIDTMGLTPAGVAEILEKTTVQAEKVGQAIRNKDIKMNILGTPLFDKTMQTFGIDTAVDKVVALANGDHIYINRDSMSFFGDIVHEGTHALDYLNDFKGNVYQWEKRAFYHDQQFQKWVDGHLDFKDMNEMIKTIHELY